MTEANLGTVAGPGPASSPDPSPLMLDAFRHRLTRLSVWRALALILTDATALMAAYLVAALITVTFSPHHVDDSFLEVIALGQQYRAPQTLGFGATLLLWLHIRGHYDLRLPFWIESWHVATACVFALLCDGFVQYALKHDFSRLWVVHMWILSVPLILTARRFAHAVLRRLGLWEIPALIVGSDARLAEARTLVEIERGLGFGIAAVSSLDAIERGYAGSWLAACHACGAQMVILAADEASLTTHQTLMSRLGLERIPFVCIQRLGGLPVFSVAAHHVVGREVLLLVGQSRLLHPLGRVVKGLFDFWMALALLVAAAPLFILFTILISRDGGPVFFAHSRLGLGGRTFRCLKFRTMVPDAAGALDGLLAREPAARQEWEKNHKLQDDPRITPIGRFLRTFSLDELPQLFNVLKGDMSLVGPRPIDPNEIERFGPNLDYYLRVRPGITGLWQVSGRNDLDYARRVELNTWYVKNWSLWLDLIILMKTIPTVLSRRGAY